MKIIEPSFKIEYLPKYETLLEKFEYFLRNCYKSEGRIGDGTDVCPQCHGGPYYPIPEDKLFPRACNVCVGRGKVQARPPSSVSMIRKYVTRMDDMNLVRQALFDANLGRLVPSVSFHDAHDGVLEHDVMTVRFVANRGFLAEITRHRHASFLVESTRYCLYTDEENPKKGQEVTVINPNFWTVGQPLSFSKSVQWQDSMEEAAGHYTELISLGAKPEEARDVLNMGLKTDIIETANFREWRYIFRMRGSKRAHPQMRQLILPLLMEVKKSHPVFFEDIYVEE